MMELSHPWAEYARLQNDLSRNHRVSDRSWGIEEGLNHILWFDHTVTLLTQTDIDRAAASRERSERHRASLRGRYLQFEEEGSADPCTAVQARQELMSLVHRSSDQDWALLCAVAEGYEYAEIAVNSNVSPSSLRARVLRLRRAA